MNEISITDINRMTHDAPELFVIDSEAAYDKQLRDLADNICRHRNKEYLNPAHGHVYRKVHPDF